MGESSDEASVKVPESKPRVDLFNAFWDRLILDSIEFARVHHHLAFFDDESKVFNLVSDSNYVWSEVHFLPSY